MDNRLLAEFIGIMLGDGSLNIYPGRTRTYRRLKITLNATKDAAYAQYIAGMIKKLFSVDASIQRRSYEKNTLDVFVFDKDVIELLTGRIGLRTSPKWNQAEIPKRFLKPSLARLVVRGYFDTDGCIAVVNNNGTVYPRLEMKVCPSPMQAQFFKILRNERFQFGAYEIGKGKVRIQMNGVDMLRKWNTTIGFSNERNSSIADAFLKKNSGGRI